MKMLNSARSLRVKLFVAKVKYKSFIISLWGLGVITGASYFLTYEKASQLYFELTGVRTIHLEKVIPIVEAKEVEKVEMLQGEFSAYTASKDETDGNPDIMANGKKVFKGAIANNCLAFGSVVVVDGVEYIVSDRMNSRYGCAHFDIYMQTKGEALEFGRQTKDYFVK